MLRLLSPLAPLLLVLLMAAPSSAVLLDFYEGLEHGEIAVDGMQTFEGYSVSITNPNRDFDLGVTFDSDQNETSDPDIEYGWQKGWSGGNLAPPPPVPSRAGIGRLGDVLILQENDLGCGDGICDDPDDEVGFPLAGIIEFVLDDRYSIFGIDLVDFGDHDGQENAFLRFYNGQQLINDFRINDLPSLLPDQEIEFGNDTANRVLLGEEVIGGGFNRIEIVIAGSGAIDNILVDGFIPVPEPGTAGLLVLGLIGLRAKRRSGRRAA